MTVLLFIFYLILFTYAIQLITETYVTKWNLPICYAFILKVIAGCAYGLLFKKYYNGDDTWLLHNYSLAEYDQLKKDGWAFFADLFKHDYNTDQSQKLFTPGASYWKNLPDNILIKLLALFNVFSRGNYYINVIFFNAIIFFGHYYLYKLFVPFFRNKEWILVVFVFLFPPLLFWESGIRKDGILFLGLTGSIHYFHQFIQNKQIRHAIAALLFFALVFLIRNFVALSMLCGLLFYFSALFRRKRKWVAYVLSTISLIAIFFATGKLSDGFNLPKQVAERQKAFLVLRTGEKTGSYIPTEPITPDPESFISNFPKAVDKAFLHPYISEAKNPLYLLAFTENLLLLFLIIYVVLFRRKDISRLFSEPLLIFCMIIVLINYLLIGYTIPFTGAIVRYRVLFELMLLIIMLSRAPKKHIS